MMAIEVIFFDLDDTLIVEEASVTEAFLAACRFAQAEKAIEPERLHQAVRQRARELWQASPFISYCRLIGISSWEGLWADFEGADPHLQRLKEWAPTYRRTAWSNALVDLGVADAEFADKLADAFRKERRMRHVLFPDTLSTLRDLKKDHRLGLITNGAPDLQREKIRGGALEKYFDTIVISGEIGVGKPDARIFDSALEALAVPAERALMVGNSLKRDIAGAKECGLRTVWLNRTGERRDEASPDAEIANLRELRPLLDEWKQP